MTVLEKVLAAGAGLFLPVWAVATGVWNNGHPGEENPFPDYWWLRLSVVVSAVCAVAFIAVSIYRHRKERLAAAPEKSRSTPDGRGPEAEPAVRDLGDQRDADHAAFLERERKRAVSIPSAGGIPPLDEALRRGAPSVPPWKRWVPPRDGRVTMPGTPAFAAPVDDGGYAVLADGTHEVIGGLQRMRGGDYLVVLQDGSTSHLTVSRVGQGIRTLWAARRRDDAPGSADLT